MRATAVPVDDHQVQLRIEIDEQELTAAIDETARRLAQQITVKGFRKGKAPRQVIEAHMGGRAALRAEALRSAVPDFYAKAVSDALVDPIGRPDVSIASGEDEGDVVLEATIEVRPEVELTGYRDLRISIPSPLVSDDELEAQVVRLREADAELVEVDRPIQMGDFITADFLGEVLENAVGDVDLPDYSYQVGSAEIANGLDEALEGQKAGDVIEAVGRRSRSDFLTFTITIKRVCERVLPGLTDDWVAENTEYATIDELHDGVRERLRRGKVLEAQLARRDAMMVAVGDLVAESAAPEILVATEVEHRASDLGDRLRRLGVNFEYFLEQSGRTRESLLESLREDALRAVRVDLALRALCREEGLEPTDEEFDQELEETAAEMKVTSAQLRTDLHDAGRVVPFRAEIAKMKATKWLMAHVTYLDETGAEIDHALFENEPTESASA
jgi:trigger factor